jgi:hypothetical protein
VQGKGKKRANDADDPADAPAKKKGEIDMIRPFCLDRELTFGHTQIAAASGSKSWILRSTLPPELIAAMNLPNEIVSRGEDEENHPAIKDCGALLHWDKGDGIAGGGVALKGILFTLLALILVRDRSVSDCELGHISDSELSMTVMLIVCCLFSAIYERVGREAQPAFGNDLTFCGKGFAHPIHQI